jgi:hypothetical protein
MRGKSGAHLMTADDGCAYVVKFANNPNGGRRALVNELLGSLLLASLGVAAPESAIVEVDDRYGGVSAPTGVHFGSRHPDPDRIAVYDFLPTALMPMVSNRDHFIGSLMFDLWTANCDARQAIFFRKPAGPAEAHWVAQMVDNGSLFSGGDWTFRDSATQGMQMQGAAYGLNLSIGDFAPWFDALTELREETLREAVAALPQDWIRGDEASLAELMRQLYERRGRVPAMVQQSLALLQAPELQIPFRREISTSTGHAVSGVTTRPCVAPMPDGFKGC